MAKPDPKQAGGTSGRPVFLLVDGHAHAYRAFHAIRSLSSPDGEPTNAIFGFVKAMQRLAATCSPSHAAVVWDGGLARERLAVLPGYKANRPPMPRDLECQFDGLAAWVRANGWRSLCAEGVEADDWIGGLARMGEAAGASVVISTSDKDFMQLVGERIRLLNPADRGGELLGPEQVVAKTGVQPHQIVDWLSLIGDSVDNIAGVPGVGPKTATALLGRFGSCAGIYEHLDQVTPPRVRDALAGARETLARNRRLIALREDAAEAVSLPELRISDANGDALRKLYGRWGFRSLLAAVTPEPANQGELW